MTESTTLHVNIFNVNQNEFSRVSGGIGAESQINEEVYHQTYCFSRSPVTIARNITMNKS